MQPQGAEARSATSGARFVGRTRELGQAVGALARPDSILVVEGEPGIGKTRLLREALRAPAIASLERLHMACPPLDEPFPFGPLVDALRRRSIDGLGLTMLAGALHPLFPEWSAHLPVPPPPLDDPRATRHRLFRAMAEVVERLGIELLVLDDAHWADSSTLELMLSLAADQESRLRFAIGYRAVDVPAGSPLVRLVSGAGSGPAPVRIGLSTLSVAETRELVASVFGVREVSEEFVGWLHDRTDGVPLAVQETLWLLRDRGDVVWKDGEWERRAVENIDVPPSVRDSVLERVDRLPATTRAVLRAASVLCDPATEAELRSVSGLDDEEAREGLATALSADLLHEDAPGSYAFRHLLAARAVEAATPVSERRRLHAAAAAALRIRNPAPLARLGRHYREADDRAAWSANAETAAGLAVASGDDHAAVTWLVELLTVGEHPPAERLRIARFLGDVAARGVASLGDTGARVTAVLREVVSAVEEPRSDVAEVRLSLGRLLLQLGEFDGAADEIEEATAGLEGLPMGAAKAAISLAWPRGHRWPAERHRTWLARASALTEAVPPGLERTWLDVDRASVRLLLGDEEGWSVAEELRPQARSTEEQRHIARLLLNMGHVAIAWGRDEQARRCLEEAVATMAATGYRRLLNSARLTLTYLDWHRGAWSGLAERTRGLADADATLPEARLEAVLTIALLGLAGGRRSASERELLRVHKELVRRGVTDSQPGPAAALGRLYLAEGDVQQALDVTGPVVDTIARKEMWLWASGLAVAHVEALLAAGDHAAAVAVVRDYERGTKVDCAPAPHAALLALHGLLEAANGDHAAAATSFHATSTAWSDIGRPLPALLASEHQARAEQAAGDQEAALRQLRSVERGLRALGARWDADRVARTLREQGVEVERVWRGGRRGYGRALSPRELEVARLVAQGLTNRQVAEALFLSPRTVERHLGAAMRKLGIAGRSTLARLAAESGLPEGEPPRDD
ncbi:MAG TPA: AAA family ATPase [Nocardioides sp.]|nr:AAA family ATPase [Nocardioides sp.]